MSKHHRKHWTTADRNRWQPVIAALVASGAPCSKCGQAIGSATWDIDHLIGLAEGGTNTAQNLWPAHRACNRSDGGRRGAAKTNGKPIRDERGWPKL